jgi:hypothetical protein
VRRDSVVVTAVSIQFLPLYGVLHDSSSDACRLPGCDELVNGFVPWVSFAVTLLAPWQCIIATSGPFITAAVSVIVVVVFAAVTAKQLNTRGDAAASVITLGFSGIVAVVRHHRVTPCDCFLRD